MSIAYRRWDGQVTATDAHSENRELRFAAYAAYGLLGDRDPDDLRRGSRYSDHRPAS